MLNTDFIIIGKKKLLVLTEEKVEEIGAGLKHSHRKSFRHHTSRHDFKFISLMKQNISA